MNPTVERIIEHWRNKAPWDQSPWEPWGGIRGLPSSGVIGGLISSNPQAQRWWQEEQHKYPYAVCVVCIYVLATGCDYLFEIPADAVKLLAACGDEHAAYMLPAIRVMNGGEP